MMASLLLPMPLLPDESKSNDSNILISLMVNGSTVVSVSAVSVASVVAIVAGGVAVGATLLNISADAIVQYQCFRQSPVPTATKNRLWLVFSINTINSNQNDFLYHSRANQATFCVFYFILDLTLQI